MGTKVKIKSGHIQSQSINGGVSYKPLIITGASGTITGSITNQSFVILDGDNAIIHATIARPEPGMFLVLHCANADNAVTAKLTAGTYDGTNNTATFSALGTIFLFGVSYTRFMITQTVGTVALSST